MSKPEAHHVWVNHIGVGWIGYISFLADLLPILGVALLAIGGTFKVDWCLFTGFGIIVAGFICVALYSFLFYRIIKCPVCGFNPTRTKEGRARKNHRATETIVSKLTACPKCSKAGV